MKTLALISLGCDKNRVDSEHMLYKLAAAGGFTVCEPADAEIIIVNTCAFIESAREESIDTVLECAQYKKTGKCTRLIVTGCLPQKYREELVQALPEVDAFLGAFEYDRIVEAVTAGAVTAERDSDFYAAENCGRVLTTLPHTAYIKVAEGCDNKCAFCTIPSIRGGYRSRPSADIVREAAGLAADGVKEIILVAQDVTRYGKDTGENIISLLDELEKLPVSLIRLLYCYPECVSDALIDKIATSPKIAKYIDIPLQHCSDKILRLMRRATTGAAARALIKKLHSRGIVVRTTLMVGFPGETQREFDELCAFVREVKPEYAGVFAFSREEGTPAAFLPDQVNKAQKLKRVRALGRECTAATRAFNQSLVGKTLRVLYEDIDFDKKMLVGRADFQTPGVDGNVYFTGSDVLVGSFYNVTITDCDDYDLYGTIGGKG